MRSNSLVLLCVLVASASSRVGAQTTAAAATATAVRVSPDGRLVATMRVGAAVKTGATKADWTAVTIEGFLHKSVVTAKKDELTVHASSGAALRASAAASSPIIAVIEDGMTVDRQSVSGDWFRVRRDAWVQTRELKAPTVKAPALVGGAPVRAPSTQGAPQRVASLPARGATAPAAPAVAPKPDASIAPGDFAAAHPLVLRAAPDGTPSGTADSAARVRIVARDHGWARVQTEGWVRESELIPVDSSSVSAVSAADLRSDPDHYKGSTVRWVVQAIAVQAADPLRKGLAPDEPYLLARGPGSESSLLYLALPSTLVASARALPPLSYIMVLARVRAGRSEPSGVPILDVLRIVPR
ncbi:MAG: SH3 domain-containing protein [Gemmatimonadaceae bacterium]